MARDAVDEAVRAMDGRVPDSVTEQIPLVGAEGWQGVRNQRRQLAARSGLHVVRIDHLLGRYGGLVHEVLDLIAADPSLAEPLPGCDDYLRAEAVYAVTHEGARHLDDVLARRTRASIEAWDRGVAAAPVVAALMAAAARLGRRAHRDRGGALPGPGGRRAGVPGAAGRRHRRRRPARRRRHRPAPLTTPTPACVISTGRPSALRPPSRPGLRGTVITIDRYSIRISRRSVRDFPQSLIDRPESRWARQDSVSVHPGSPARGTSAHEWSTGGVAGRAHVAGRQPIPAGRQP